MRFKYCPLSMPVLRCRDRIRRVLLIVPFLWVFALPCLAAEHPEQDAHQAAETGVEFQPRLGEYHYEIRWEWKRVATGIITIGKEDDHYVLTADQRTTDFIDRTYRVRYRGETRIDAEALTPTESIIEEETRKRRKVQKATYDSESGSVSVEETRTKGKKTKPKTKTYEIYSDSGIMDVFSSIFLARSFDWSVGERHEFLVFIGEKQYAVTLDCIGMSSFDIENHRIPVWVIQPFVRKITGDNSPSKPRESRMYLAADESKDLVKLETESGIGTVTLQLVRYQGE